MVVTVSPTFLFPQIHKTLYTPSVHSGGKVDSFRLQRMSTGWLVDLKVCFDVSLLEVFSFARPETHCKDDWRIVLQDRLHQIGEVEEVGRMI